MKKKIKKFFWDILVNSVKPLVGKKICTTRLFRKLDRIYLFLFRYLGAETRFKVKRKGITYDMIINPKEGNLERDIVVKGVFAKDLFDLFAKYIKPNDVVLDVGANIGFFTLEFSNLVGENGKIYAFEPVKRTYSRLKENLELNKIKNTSTYRLALGSKK